MKKILGVLLSILFTIPMLVGMCFLSPASQATLNGGGGGNSLISPITEINKEDSSVSSKELPNEYTEVEYIYSTKSQYLDTKIYPTNTTEIVMKIDFKNEIDVIDTTTGNAFLGATDTNNHEVFSTNFGSTATESLTVYNWCNQTYECGEPISTIHLKETEIGHGGMVFNKRSGFSCIGSSRTTTAITNAYEQMEYTLGIFGYNNTKRGGEQSFTRYDMYVYYCRIFDEGTMVRDFVPCIKNADGVAGLYDFISQEFFVSSTATNFVAGNVIAEKSNFRSFDDMFYDKNVSYSTTKDCLSGNGSLSTPYVVKSTEAFLYLVKCFSFNSKYIEIESNIILNEESFDKNGNPLNGDGIVYEWQSIAASTNSIDGKNHTIYGLWQKREKAEQSTIGLFAKNFVQQEIKNLKMANVFVYEGLTMYNHLFATQITTLTNCHVLSGSFFAEQGSLAIFCNTASQISDCSNYADISTNSGSCAGITITAKNYIRNTNNYGNVTAFAIDVGASGRTSGIANSVSVKAKIINSHNYGEICAHGQQAGGIVNWAYGTIEKCNNYGSVYSSVRGAGGIASIAYQAKGTRILNCNNYGEVKRPPGDSLFGAFLGDCSSSKEILIKNCHDYSYSLAPMVGFVHDSVISIVDCKKILKDKNVSDTGRSCLLIGAVRDTENSHIDIKNIEIDISCNVLSIVSLTVFWQQLKQIQLENVFITVKCKKINYTSVSLSNTYFAKQNVLVDFEFGDYINRKIYGHDFSGFYCDWKTGKLGLKAFAGKGFYQGKVTEDLLIQKGFVKG